MRNGHMERKLKRVIAALLTVALFASDHAILYGAEADAGIAAESEAVHQESAADTDSGEQETYGNTAAVSGGDAAEGTVDADEGDTADAADSAGAFGDAGSVSGGDAVPGEDSFLSEGLPEQSRLPEQFYEEERPEAYGTLVSYDEYSRTYHVDGSRYVTVVGNDGSTFIDGDGNLMPVDNTLEKESAAVFGMSGEGQETGYVNRANDYMVFLPENPNLAEGRGITIADGDALITLYPAEGSFQNGQARDNAIRYSSVFPGVDYQYTVLGNSVKEDIILLERGEKNSFSYFIDPCGLAWELRNNTLYLYEAGTDPEADAVFVLEAPEMMDSAGELSFGVRLSIEEKPIMEEASAMEGQDNMLLVMVTADEGWLSAPERVYPVRIDPTAVQVTGSAIRMACAEEGSPGTAIGDNQYPYVGYDDGITSGNYAGFGSRHLNCRTYFSVDYDFASLLSEAEIVSASFQVTQKTGWSRGKSEFGLYGVEEAWTVKGLTWNSQLDYSHYFLDAQNAGTRGRPFPLM